MVGLVKQYLHKAIGKVTFTKQELKEVLVDTEMNLSHWRSLAYIDDSLQFSVFTPNILIHKEPKARAKRSLSGHRDELKPLTLSGVHRWQFTIFGIYTEHSNTQRTKYNNRRTIWR